MKKRLEVSVWEGSKPDCRPGAYQVDGQAGVLADRSSDARRKRCPALECEGSLSSLKTDQLRNATLTRHSCREKGSTQISSFPSMKLRVGGNAGDGETS